MVAVARWAMIIDGGFSPVFVGILEAKLLGLLGYDWALWGFEISMPQTILSTPPMPGGYKR